MPNYIHKNKSIFPPEKPIQTEQDEIGVNVGFLNNYYDYKDYGNFKVGKLPEIHKKMDALLSCWGVRIDHYSLCTHRPEDYCDCRKPHPKLLQDAAATFNIDIKNSFMVGDKPVDLEAGRNAGVGHGRKSRVD